MSDVIDLTDHTASTVTIPINKVQESKKRDWRSIIPSNFLQQTPTSSVVSPITPNQRVALPPTSAPQQNISNLQSVTKKAKKTLIKDKPHVLIWICHNGLGQKRTWSGNSLKIVGVFASKEAAEQKKTEIMNNSECYGNGDICVGGTWEDEIDLVIKPTELFLE